jgi:hypothetical protein
MKNDRNGNGSWEKKPVVRRKRTRKDRLKEQLPRPFNVTKGPSRDMNNWCKAQGIIWQWEPDKPVSGNRPYKKSA